jgi:hypothetical protein
METVAAGQVGRTEWLRAFGKLLIADLGWRRL